MVSMRADRAIALCCTTSGVTHLEPAPAPCLATDGPSPCAKGLGDRDGAGGAQHSAEQVAGSDLDLRRGVLHPPDQQRAAVPEQRHVGRGEGDVQVGEPESRGRGHVAGPAPVRGSLHPSAQGATWPREGVPPPPPPRSRNDGSRCLTSECRMLNVACPLTLTRPVPTGSLNLRPLKYPNLVWPSEASESSTERE